MIGPASKDREGGYLRVLKCGYRFSDSAPMAIVELVDKDIFKPAEKKLNFVISELLGEKSRYSRIALPASRRFGIALPASRHTGESRFCHAVV